MIGGDIFCSVDVVSVVMNRKMFMVCRHVLCHAWDTMVLVVSLDTDVFRLKGRRREEISQGWNGMWLERRFSIGFPCVNIANTPNRFVTRMGLLAESQESPAKVMFVAVSVCCCAQFVGADTSLMLSVGL